jgi:exopolysaccharide production protein ExoZ
VLLVALIAFGIFGGPVRLVMFVFGAILAEVLSARRGPGSIFGALAGLAGLAWMLVPAQGASEQALRYAVLGLCAGVLCHAALSGRAPALVAVLCFRPLRWLGNMSYSYYLMHGLALHAFFLVVERILAPDALPGIVTLLLVPAFLWTLCPSAMLFLAVERPLSLASPKR